MSSIQPQNLHSPQFDRNSCSNCPIRHRAVCSRCDGDELQHLEDMKFYRSYEAGQTIIWRGDYLENVASLVTGIATISQTMEDGRTQMLGLLLPSDFIGRPGSEYAAYDVVAVRDVKLCCFRRKPFEELIRNTPHVGERLMEMALDELDAAREWMLLLGRKTAREKIASLLCLVARRTDTGALAGTAGHGQSPGQGIDFDLPITREMMANYLGLTLETVSRQLSQLKAAGIIQLTSQRKVVVPDLRRLAAETGDVVH